MRLLRLILIFIACILTALYFVSGLDVDIKPLSYILVLLCNIYMVIGARKNIMALVIALLISYFNYSIIYANFIIGFDNTSYTQPFSLRSYVIALNILTLFNLLLAVFAKWHKVMSLPKENFMVLKKNGNDIIVFGICLFLTLLFIFGFNRVEIGEEGGGGTPLYEYSVIFFMMLFYYSGGKKVTIRVGLIIVLIFCLQNFVFGGRVMGLQMLFCAFFMLYVTNVKLSLLLPILAGIFVLFSIIGSVRQELLLGNFDVGSIMLETLKRGFALDTAYSAYHTSESYAYVRPMYTDDQALNLFLEYIKSIFLGSKDEFDLSYITHNHVEHSFGCILPFTFYFYLGTFGVVLSALLVASYINLISKISYNERPALKLIAVWITCTVFRWYLYSPSPLLRGVFLLMIVFIFFEYINSTTRRLTSKHIKGNHYNQ